MANVAKVTVPVLLLALLRIASAASWQHKIYISNSSNTSDNSCWTGGWHNPCAGINLALRGAQSYNFSTVLLIQPGNYSLHDAEETYFHNVTQVAMIGNSSEPGEAVIHCQFPAGLFFADSQDIVIRSLTFSNCGIMFKNRITAALYFGACVLVEISKVSCKFSRTRVIVFEDTIGNVTVQNSEFSLCAGGLAIVQASTSRGAKVRSRYVLNNITVTDNNATVSYLPLPISFCPRLDIYPSLGMGAGLVVVLKNSTNKNQIILSNSTFSGNKASFGGGLLVALCNDLQSNQLIVSDTSFSKNRAVVENMNDEYADGGGALLALENVVGSENTVLFTRCQFVNNTASHGGGLAIVSYPQTRIYHKTCFKNSIQINGCVLSGNEAYLGLALYLYGIRPIYGKELSIKMSGVLMSANLPASTHITTTGVLYSYDSSFTFSDKIALIENNDTVLLMEHSDVIVAEGAHVSFSDNSVSFGKVAVLDCSSITLGENTVLEFSSNHQVLAVVYATCSLQRSNRGCFLKYVNDRIHPDNWTAEVSFAENTGCSMMENDWQCVHGGFDTSNVTLIYDTNIISCAWSESNNSESTNYSDHSSIFMWQSFQYHSDNYSSMIMSGPTELCISNDSFHMEEYSDYTLPISVKNYLGEEISDGVFLKLCLMEEHYKLYYIPLDYFLPCFYMNPDAYNMISVESNTNSMQLNFHQHVIHIQLSTLGINEINRRFEISFTPCLEIWTYCVSANNTHMFYGKCPWLVYYDIACAEQTMDNCHLNRTGILCSNCTGKLCVSINSLQFSCAEHQPMALLLYVCLQILPLTLFLLLLIFFGVSLNYLATNSYILYGQMTYMSVFILESYYSYGDSNYVYAAVPYSMWSLDFFTIFQIDPFCLFPGMTTIHVILVQYVTAFYPLLVIVVIFAWIEMYARGVKLVFPITRPVAQLLARLSQKMKIQQSLPDSFAVLYVLSYTQLVRISVQLLIPTQLAIASNDTSVSKQTMFYYDGRLPYFSGEHLVCAVIAIVVLIVFVVLPTIFLILYPFKMFRMMLSFLGLNRPGLEVLYDAFSGSFRNGLTSLGYDMRCFTGMMLLFRVVIIALNILGFEYINGFLSFVMAGFIVLLQPYKRKATNVLDFLMFMYIGLELILNYFGGHYNTQIVEMISVMIPLPFFFSSCFMLYLVLYRVWSAISSSSCRGAAINEIDVEEDIEEHEPLLLDEDHDLDDGGFADRLLNPEQYANSDEDVAIRANQPDANCGVRLQRVT